MKNEPKASRAFRHYMNQYEKSKLVSLIPMIDVDDIKMRNKQTKKALNNRVFNQEKLVNSLKYKFGTEQFCDENRKMLRKVLELQSKDIVFLIYNFKRI